MDTEKAGQKQLRAAILAIQKDSTLDAETKSKKIRVRHSPLLWFASSRNTWSLALAMLS
jgi:hypothetical protein